AKYTVVLTGPDGAGKSRVSSELVQTFNANGAGAVLCSIWDAQNESSFFQNRAEVQKYLAQIPSLSRLLFLAHAFSVSFEKAQETAAREQKDLIVVDSYIYKYLVTEMTFGMPRDKALTVGRLFPKPDIVFYLNAKASLAAERKDGNFSNYETGPSGPTNSEAFKTVQEKGRVHWQSVRACFGPWVELDASQGVPELIGHIAAQIGESRCPTPSPFPL
ncbi:MAG: hypothetical protein ABL958_08850, partial [Bdellovibrionia bacterium]